MAAYPRPVRCDAVRRGCRFDGRKVGRGGGGGQLPAPRRQLQYEWAHLARKLETRAPSWLGRL